MTPMPTTPTRSGRSTSRVATCTMMDEFPPAGAPTESLLARQKAAGDARGRACGHVLNQRVTCRRAVSGSSAPSLWAKLQEPGDEAANPLGDRRVGPEADGARKLGGISTGLRSIPVFTRAHPRHRRLAAGLLDQPHDLGPLARLAVADIVTPPRCPARGGIGGFPRPGGIRRRRLRNKSHDRFDRIVDVGE